ncbi:MAG: sugar ABC transporter permease [Armatimonadetes bacterium]|nr:sugar ABC transporter permease [Candidatus Hippobium faecium]
MAKEKYNKKEVLAAWGFLTPNLIGFLIFTLIPVVFSMVMAFTNWNIFGSPKYIGIENFVNLLGFHSEEGKSVPNDPFFWQYLYNTVYLLIGLPLGIAGALICALIMNQKLKGITFFRLIYFLPTVSGGVALLILWKYMFNHEIGLINQFLRSLGGFLYSNPITGFITTALGMLIWGIFIVACCACVVYFIKWIIDKTKADVPDHVWTKIMFVIGAVMFVLLCWKYTNYNDIIKGFLIEPPDWLGTVAWSKPSMIIMGFWGAIGGTNMILYLAALSGVSPSLYEAAEIDGANGWKKFWSITWPMISPTTFFIFVMGVIGGLQTGFTNAKVMTNGGPAGSTTTVEYYLYNTAFQNFNMGYASAIAWFMFIIILILTLITWKVGGSVVTYE